MSQAMTTPAKRAATYADLVAASDLLIAEEASFPLGPLRPFERPRAAQS